VKAQVVSEKTDIADTSFVDTKLRGSTEYFYQVVVVTDRDEEAASAAASGAIHELVGSWPLDLQGEGGQQEYVRLYADPEGEISALVATDGMPLVLFRYTSGGLLIDRKQLRAVDNSDGRATATTLDAEGQRYVGMASFWAGNPLAVVAFGPDGDPQWTEHEPFADDLSDALGGAEQIVKGEIGIVGSCNCHTDSVSVWVGEELVYGEGFADLPADLPDGPGSWRGWEFSPNPPNAGPGGRASWYGSFAAVRTDPSWRDFRLVADVVVPAGQIGIQIGGSSHSRFVLSVSLDTQQALLDWYFEPPAGTGLDRREVHLSHPLDVVSTAVYRLALEVADGRVRASVTHPVVWKGESGDAPVSWTALSTFAGQLAFTADERAFTISRDGSSRELSGFVSPVSEIRTWQTRGQRENWSWLGVCMPGNRPGTGTVRWGSLRSGGSWTSLNKAVGPWLGAGRVGLSFPISLAGGPDGTIFVLDAGNNRIVAYDVDGEYTTEWGGQSDGEGDFELSRGNTIGFCYGSICVDEEGFIYVADVYNKRILKYSP